MKNWIFKPENKEQASYIADFLNKNCKHSCSSGYVGKIGEFYTFPKTIKTANISNPTHFYFHLPTTEEIRHELISFQTLQTWVEEYKKQPKNTILKGYKGFKKDLTCLNYQYVEGKLHEFEGNISICNRGFHFCKELKQVFAFYHPEDESAFVYHEVSIPEDAQVIESNTGDKCVTNKLIVGKRVDMDKYLEEESKQQLKQLISDVYLPIQNKNPYIYLGGSAALMVMGLLPYRRCKDLDIVSPFYQDTQEIVNNTFNVLGLRGETWSGCDVKSSITYKGRTIELFVNETGKYSTIEWEGLKLKLSDPYAIISAKLRYTLVGNQKTKLKHSKDIIKIMECLNKQAKLDLPY